MRKKENVPVVCSCAKPADNHTALAPGISFRHKKASPLRLIDLIQSGLRVEAISRIRHCASLIAVFRSLEKSIRQQEQTSQGKKEPLISPGVPNRGRSA